MTRFEALRAVMDRLREPGGCPWDREQRREDLRATVIEEAHEVAAAIDENDPQHLCEELGDLLLQVVFLSRIEQEEGRFDIDEVIARLHDKLVRRHPHVFADGTAGTPAEVLQTWERIKNSEDGARPRRILDGVPRAMPALLRAARLSQKAALAGFDWERDEEVHAKLEEEMAEYLAESRRGDRAAMERELGDVLFVLVNLGRRAGLDPEAALQGANDRFVRRFGHVEERLQEEGRSLQETSLERMEELWQEAKRGEEPSR